MRHRIGRLSIVRHAVLGPDGSVLTPVDLPPANTVRWVARRKAEVIAAVHGGLLTMAEACTRYRLSSEEFLEWERQFKKHGLNGLKASIRPAPRPSLH